MNLHKIYGYALSREQQGLEFFQSHAGRVTHAAAASIFRRLADEERKHIQFVEGLLRSLDLPGSERVAVDGLAEVDLFAGRAQSEVLDQAVIESMIPDIAVLRTAYLIERDFAEFYERAAETAEGENRSALTALARWERGHERLFKDLHDRVFQEYSEMPWGG